VRAPRYIIRDRDRVYGQLFSAGRERWVSVIGRLRRGRHGRSAGSIIAFPEVGGLHHRYERRSA